MNSVIYEPKGKAREYCELACNLYNGCGHACTYCYAPAATRTARLDFEQPVPRKDILKRLTVDASETLFDIQGPLSSVLLSFTSDAYQSLDVELGITRKAIKILHNAGYFVTILTKGGKRAERDFDLMGPNDTHAASLTLLNDAESLKWEPGAALPDDRIATLEKAYALGMR